MKKKNNNSKAALFYLIGNFSKKGIAFLTVPVFTRILSTHDYGIINTYASWVSILSIVLGMTFHMGIRSAFNEYKDKIDDFMSSITFFVIIVGSMMSTVIIVILWLLQVKIDLFIIVLCLLQAFFMAIIENYSMYLMMKLEYIKRTILMVLPNLIITLLAIITIVFYLQTDLYMGRIIPSTVVYVLFGMSIILIIFKKSKNITQKKYWDFAVRVSFPIILHGLSLNILSQSDRIMLTSLIGASETGVYSLIYNFGMISYVVVVSLDGVWVPWFYKNLAKKDFRIINKNAKVYIDIMAVVTSIIILMSIEIMRFIAPPQYWYGEIIIPPIVISSFIIFVYTLYVNVEHYYKETRLIAFNTIVAAISNIMMNLFFIPSFGILGAATSTLISYILSLIMHYKNSRKIESNLFPIGVIFKPMVLILVTVLVYYSFREYTVIRWTIALVIIVMLCRKYKDIIISKFKAK